MLDARHQHDTRNGRREHEIRTGPHQARRDPHCGGDGPSPPEVPSTQANQPTGSPPPQIRRRNPNATGSRLPAGSGPPPTTPCLRLQPVENAAKRMLEQKPRGFPQHGQDHCTTGINVSKPAVGRGFNLLSQRKISAKTLPHRNQPCSPCAIHDQRDGPSCTVAEFPEVCILSRRLRVPCPILGLLCRLKFHHCHAAVSRRISAYYFRHVAAH